MKLILVFSIIWLVIMFLILPIGLKVPNKTEKGFADSSPSVHYLWQKLLGSAVVSIILTAIYWYKFLLQ